MNNVPLSIIENIKKIHIDFIWQMKETKIKHTALIADYCNGCYKDVDIESKIESLRLSWVKRLCDNNFHVWKIIPVALLDLCGGLLVFHSNLSAESLSYSKTMPSFYVNLMISWEIFSRIFPEPKESEKLQYSLSQSLWHNLNLKIDDKSFYDKHFADAGLNTVADLFDEKGVLLSWEKYCSKGLPSTKCFKFIQIVNSIPQSWLKVIRVSRNSSEFCHVEENLSGLEMLKLTSRKIYWILVQRFQTCLTSQKGFKLN